MNSEHIGLKNPPVFAGLVVYYYLCETWKREREHEVNPITDKAKLLRKTDEILFAMERKRYRKEYIDPYYFSVHRNTYVALKNRISKMNYKKLISLYKTTMNPALNPLR